MKFLSRESTLAKPGFNRWLVPPAAIAAHMCIGQVYGFSVFNKPLEEMAKASGANWSKLQVTITYSIALFMLGMSSAVFGKWVERNGPRKSIAAACLCFCGGMAIAGLGVKLQMLSLIYLGYGFFGGMGLGLGYIGPVSTLMKWFPDRPGMATGMAIMGFGGGALIGAPLATQLMGFYKQTSAAPCDFISLTFWTMAAIYAVSMIFAATIVRVPHHDWKPEGWTPGAAKKKNAMVATGHVAVDNAWKTPQFWMLWLVLCMNVSAGIGILARASDIIQDMFNLSTVEGAAKAAAIGAGFAGLLSIFNCGGRFVWSSVSDLTGRKVIYCIYFILGAILYCSVPYAQTSGNKTLFVVLAMGIISMYGGGFATIPAYLKDMFGTHHVGAIHGRLITAWSIAAVIGPVLVTKLFEANLNSGVPKAEAYNNIMYVMAGLLMVGLVANLLVKPVDSKHHLTEEELAKSAPAPKA